MKKKFILLVFSALLLIQCSIPVAASEYNPSVKVTAGYYLDDILYTFVEKNTTTDNSKMTFNMEINNYSVGEDYLNDNVAKSTNVSYMLLVDLSTSMPSYRNMINAFAQALIESQNAKTKITVATFGERFEVRNQNLTTSSDISEALNNLQYNQNATDICGGVNKALNYLSKNKREPGELVNLVLITDGKPYMANYMDNQQEVIEASAKKTKKHLSNTSDVIVHSISFGEWENTTYDAVTAGTGKHTIAYTTDDAINFASLTAEFVDSLYPLSYYAQISDDIKSFDSHITIKFKNKNKIESIKEKSIRNLNYVNTGNSTANRPDNKPDKNAKPNTSAVKKADTKTQKDTKPTDASTAKKDNTKSESKTPVIDTNLIKLGLIIGIIAVALLSVVLTFIIVKKSKNKAKTMSAYGIKMIIEDISGNCKNKSNEIVLYNEIIIGRKSSCDIVLDDKTVAPINSRIFLNDKVIYIENIDTNGNTAIGGMKIYSPNKLRSGDEITVGKSVFCLRF